MGTVLAAIKLGWHQNGLVEPAIFWQASLIDTAKEACGEKLDESTPGRPCTLSPEFGGANTSREYSGEIFPRIREIFPRKNGAFRFPHSGGGRRQPQRLWLLQGGAWASHVAFRVLPVEWPTTEPLLMFLDLDGD